MPDYFSYATIERVITFDDEGEGYTEEEDWSSEFQPCDLREALEQLTNGCWDNLEQRETELIAYPADSHQNYQTGAYESETLVIRARRPEWLDRLVNCYHNSERGIP